MDKFDIQISNEKDDPYWDTFVLGCKNGHHEQSSLWGKVKCAYGWNPARVMVLNQERIMGGFQILIRPVGILGSVGYVCKGPLVNMDDPGLIARVVVELRRYVLARRLTYIVVELPYNGVSLGEKLRSLGFVTHPANMPPTGLMRATAYLNLSDSLDTILAQMKASRRGNIKQGMRRGVVVREGSVAELELFRKMMAEVCRRRGVAPTPPQPDFFDRLWKEFHPAGYVRLFLGEYAGEVVNAEIVFSFGEWVRAWKHGWSGLYSDRHPNEVLYWEIIKWAKGRGYRYYDFVGIDSDMARAVLDGRIVDSHMDGASYFKLGFGGKILQLQKPLCYFCQPGLRFVFNTAGARILNFKAFPFLANKVHSAISSAD